MRDTSPRCEAPLPLRRYRAGISKCGEASAEGTSSPLASGAKEKCGGPAGRSQGGFPRLQLRGSREGMGASVLLRAWEAAAGARQEAVGVGGKDGAALGTDAL